MTQHTKTQEEERPAPWFVEERIFNGEFRGSLYSACPSARRACGGRRIFRQPPVQIAPEHVGLPLENICQIYGGSDVS